MPAITNSFQRTTLPLSLETSCDASTEISLRVGKSEVKSPARDLLGAASKRRMKKRLHQKQARGRYVQWEMGSLKKVCVPIPMHSCLTSKGIAFVIFRRGEWGLGASSAGQSSVKNQQQFNRSSDLSAEFEKLGDVPAMSNGGGESPVLASLVAEKNHLLELRS